MKLSFRFHPVATVAMIVGVAILFTLGSWQLQRRAWKLDLIEAVAARADIAPRPLRDVLADIEKGQDQRYAAVRVTGTYQHEQEFHVFGLAGPTPGYFIFTLFKSSADDGMTFFVNRGFVPQDYKLANTRQAAQISQEISVRGLFRLAEKKPALAGLLSPADEPKANVWYTRAPENFAARLSKAVATGWYIDSDGAEIAGEPYPRGGQTRIEFNNRHLEYALTWFGLGATLIGVWLAYSIRRV